MSTRSRPCDSSPRTELAYLDDGNLCGEQAPAATKLAATKATTNAKFLFLVMSTSFGIGRRGDASSMGTSRRVPWTKPAGASPEQSRREEHCLNAHGWICPGRIRQRSKEGVGTAASSQTLPSGGLFPVSGAELGRQGRLLKPGSLLRSPGV